MDDFKELEGKIVNKIYMDEDNLKFDTDQGSLAWTVYGDCCSSSYYHDFYGVNNLIGKKIKSVNSVSLSTADELVDNGWGDDIKVYGYQVVFEGDYGDQTAVFSFRNRSNGYYGGWAEKCSSDVSVPEITKDTVLL